MLVACTIFTWWQFKRDLRGHEGFEEESLSLPFFGPDFSLLADPAALMAQ